MKKNEFIAKIAEKKVELNEDATVKVTKKEAGEWLEAVLGAVVDSVAAGEEVKLVGFGNWEIKERPQRVGRNPKDGTELVIPASKSVKFKAGKILKDAVNA